MCPSVRLLDVSHGLEMPDHLLFLCRCDISVGLHVYGDQDAVLGSTSAAVREQPAPDTGGLITFTSFFIITI